MPGGIGGEMHLQIGRRLVMVGARSDWVADGGGVSLGNAFADW